MKRKFRITKNNIPSKTNIKRGAMPLGKEYVFLIEEPITKIPESNMDNTAVINGLAAGI